jgi:hypothetical protein
MPPEDPNAAEPGKRRTPCESMHVAYWRRSPPGCEPPAAPVAAGGAIVVVPRLATPAWEEPPLQAAVAMAKPITAEATSGSRRRDDENTTNSAPNAPA